jgi:hypothetical protein
MAETENPGRRDHKDRLVKQNEKEASEADRRSVDTVRKDQSEREKQAR